MLPSDELYAQDLQRRRAEREANSVEIKEPSLPQSFSVIFRKLRSLRILHRAHEKNMHILNNVHADSFTYKYILRISYPALLIRISVEGKMKHTK